MFKGLMLRRIKPVNSHIIQKTELRLLDDAETVISRQSVICQEIKKRGMPWLLESYIWSPRHLTE